MNVKCTRILLAGGIAACVNGVLLLILVLLNRPSTAFSSPSSPETFKAPVLITERVELPAPPKKRRVSPPVPPPVAPAINPEPVFEKPVLEPLTPIPVAPAPVPNTPVVSSPEPVVDAAPAPSETESESDDILDAEGVDTPPRELTRARPRYPSVARQLGREGEVELKLLINAAGRVEEVQVLNVVGHRSFERAVLAVAEHWQFSPPLHQGRPVRVWALKTVRFQLQD